MVEHESLEGWEWAGESEFSIEIFKVVAGQFSIKSNDFVLCPLEFGMCCLGGLRLLDEEHGGKVFCPCTLECHLALNISIVVQFTRKRDDLSIVVHQGKASLSCISAHGESSVNFSLTHCIEAGLDGDLVVELGWTHGIINI